MEKKSQRNLIDNLTIKATKAIATFSSELMPDGSYPGISDIACYFKQPMMFISADMPDLAGRILKYICTTFLRKNGDFRPDDKEMPKSKNPAYNEYYTYTNGWIARAAIRLKMEDILIPAFNYLAQFHDISTGGFYTHQQDGNDYVTDIITTAHLGLIHLENNNMEVAVNAGDYLCDSLVLQPNLDIGFYLRRGSLGKCITEFPDEAAPMFVVSKTKPEQLYFMVAYPIAYLGLLHEKTGLIKYFEAAKAYIEFTRSCHENIYSSKYSHKLAWALSILHKNKPDDKYIEEIKQITGYFKSIQSDEGMWFAADPLSCYDQTAEVACWFNEISKNLSTVENFNDVNI